MSASAPTTAIAVFVKTPNLSPLKTRLAAGIGEEKALEFYHLSLNAIQAVLNECDAQGFWAVGENDGLNDPIWTGMERLYTGEGSLGQRQNHIYKTLQRKFDSVLLIGADAPQISPEIITQSQNTLKTHNFVIGPAHDGGYYLFGGRIPIDANVWTSVQYSQSNTRTDLIKALPNAPALLPMLSDVDTKDNLADILTQMPPHPNTAQQTLMNWIKKI